MDRWTDRLLEVRSEAGKEKEVLGGERGEGECHESRGRVAAHMFTCP